MDLLVNLYDMPIRQDNPLLEQAGVRILRALAPDRETILTFVQKHFGQGWTGECATALARNPASCFIAIQDNHLLGFACYDATARGYFGPIGVMVEQHIPGTGGALLRRCLTAMREEGYGYAIIGNGSRVQKFYEKNAGK